MDQIFFVFLDRKIKNNKLKGAQVDCNNCWIIFICCYMFSFIIRNTIISFLLLKISRRMRHPSMICRFDQNKIRNALKRKTSKI